MDELAYALDIDPIELRIRNEPDVHPELGVAVQRSPPRRVHARGRAPLRLGSRPSATGERARRPVARRLRDGRRRSARTFSRRRTASVALEPDGTCGRALRHDRHRHGHVHDPDAGRGRGRSGVPLDRVRVELGDSNYPPAPAPADPSARRTRAPRVQARVSSSRETLRAGSIPEDGVEAEGEIAAHVGRPELQGVLDARVRRALRGGGRRRGHRRDSAAPHARRVRRRDASSTPRPRARSSSAA